MRPSQCVTLAAPALLSRHRLWTTRSGILPMPLVESCSWPSSVLGRERLIKLHYLTKVAFDDCCFNEGASHCCISTVLVKSLSHRGIVMAVVAVVVFVAVAIVEVVATGSLGHGLTYLERHTIAMSASCAPACRACFSCRRCQGNSTHINSCNIHDSLNDNSDSVKE